ncbi:MAG: hypothetical protein ACRD10_12265, partial [Terriglobia bacterium]
MHLFSTKGLHEEFLLVLALLLLPSMALATEIPVTGTATVAGANSFNIVIAGPGLNLHSTTPDAPTDASGCSIPSYLNAGFLPMSYESGGVVNGISAGILGGALSVSPCFGPGLMPAAPATVSGNIIGYRLLPDREGLGPEVFDVRINGAGIAVMDSPDPGSTEAYYAFSGTAGVVPESGTALL